MNALIEKFKKRDAHVVVVGIGYVGLPLVVEFARAGFRVTGYDKDPNKVRELAAGRSYIADVPSEDFAAALAEKRLFATTDPAVLRTADAIIVCVPTPLNKTKDPDMRFIASATEEIAQHLHPSMVVVLESTTYPGTTREVVAPRLEQAGAKLGKDVFVAFSPERVDPGNKVWKTKNTPKVIGGLTAECTEVAKTLYSQAIDRIVPVTSTDAAEMVKLLENTFRAVNIGLVNEVAIMCQKLGIDTWEVIDAASSKPFGFMPFFPGPGLGGHCIPIDPLYLSWKLRTLKYQARFIELADSINSAMPDHTVVLVADALNARKKAINGSRILVSGIAYKRDIDDVRESPALDIIDLLRRRGAEVSYHDRYIPELDEHGADTVPSLIGMKSLPDPIHYDAFDAVVIVTDHSDVDYERMVREAPVIVDTRNVLRRKGIATPSDGRISRL
ncbi:MAG: nucleotide sugar dehydrogenase [Deltaproteobacteria bacterium]|nr:nucleotide sugar dehydrogenase [Deltaproteobacteria bacterium]